jgi:methylenetetrahydrofolate--tRNA-(uracil-5-)-methyltransferase
MPRVTIVGGGFAGVEAAWAAARLGVPVRLYEMRPKRNTPAHKTGWLAELVCSNSFKSMLPTTPSGQLKWEMERLGSLVIPTAREFAVPAGEALAVDREAFAKAITARIELHPLIEVVREEVASHPTRPPADYRHGTPDLRRARRRNRAPDGQTAPLLLRRRVAHRGRQHD